MIWVLMTVPIFFVVVIHGFWYGWTRQRALMRPPVSMPRTIAKTTPVQKPARPVQKPIERPRIPDGAVVSEDGSSYFLRTPRGAFRRFPIKNVEVPK